VGVGGGKETVIGLWLHDLTVFALVKPMVELAEFVKVAWPVGGEGGKDHKAEDREDGNDDKNKNQAQISITHAMIAFSITVEHFPGTERRQIGDYSSLAISISLFLALSIKFFHTSENATD
jgi:hypothetical protein